MDRARQPPRLDTRSRRVPRALAVAVTLLLTTTQVAADQPDPLTLDASFSSQVLGGRVLVLVDAEARFDATDVSALSPDDFTQSTQEVPSFGFSSAAYWFRIEVENRLDHPVPWLLEVGYPHLDHIDLYGDNDTDNAHGANATGAAKHSSTGDRMPFSTRDLHYRNVVFERAAPPGRHVYLLRVASSGPVTVPVTAWSRGAFFDHVNAQSPPLWMFYGLMLVMSVYNLFVYFAARERAYLYYVLYIAGFSAFQFTLNGLSFQYLWPNAPAWGNQFMPIAIGFAFAMGVQFMRHFVVFWEHYPRYDRFARILGVGGGALSILLAFTTPTRISIRFAIIMGIAVILLAVPPVFVMAFRGQRQARYYAAAWVVFLVGILFYLLKSTGIIPTNVVTEWTIQIGAALETVMLSLGLADKINVMRRNLAGLNRQLESNVERLTHALDQAEEAQRAKSAFLAGVSHELRTPLNAIINVPEGLLAQYRQTRIARCGSCESTFDIDENEVINAQTPCPECSANSLTEATTWVCDADPETTVGHLRMVHRAGNHLLDVVSDILDISKLEAGKVTIDPAPLNLGSLVRDALEPMDELARSKGVTLRIDVPETECVVSGDATKLRQVVLNLVGNAIKFSDGRGEVRVSLSVMADHARIGVHDQGVGIAEADKAKLFGRFVQAHAGETRRFGGTGLGLAISKQLVELHGGELWFDSELGRGSDFYVRLPLLSSQALGNTAQAAQAAQAAQ